MQQSVGQYLKLLIEKKYSSLKLENLFFQKLQMGGVTPGEVAVLLKGTQYLILHTPLHLQLALELAPLQLSGESAGPLIAYFEEHLQEEQGHDKWAEADLAFMKENFGLKNRDVPLSMKNLVAFIENTLVKDVRLYLPYILFAEYFAVVAVPESAQLLVEKCQIPAEAVSVFTKHALLDIEHAREDVHLIDLVARQDPFFAEKCEQVILSAFSHYENFLSEICYPRLKESYYGNAPGMAGHHAV
jgi:hypothetical protein